VVTWIVLAVVPLALPLLAAAIRPVLTGMQRLHQALQELAERHTQAAALMARAREVQHRAETVAEHLRQLSHGARR